MHVTPPAQNTKDPFRGFCILCWGAGSNRRPFALQANALPTELPQQNQLEDSTIFRVFYAIVTLLLEADVPDP